MPSTTFASPPSSTPPPAAAPNDVDGDKLDAKAAFADALSVDVSARSNFSYEEGRKIMRGVDFHIMPLLMLAYLLKNLDGNAISYVNSMNAGEPTNVRAMLNMSQNMWAWTGTIFSISFVLTEMPSNMIMKVSTPRWHFIRIIGLWSIACACTAASTNAAGILTCRFFLGLFEGGLYPGIMVFLTFWYRPDEIGVRYALINVLGQWASILDALLTFGLSYVSGKHGLAGWQATFILLGSLGVVVAALFYFFMPNYPDTAYFLTDEERQWVQARLPANSARGTERNFSWKEVRLALTDPLTWGFMFLTLFYNSGTYGLNFWLPTIISDLGFTSTAAKQLLNIPPAFIYVCSGVLGAWICDRFTKIPRPAYLLGNAVVLIGLFCGLAFCRSTKGLYALICVLQVFAGWAINIYWPWRAQTLKGASYAAVAIGFQNGGGGLAGFYTSQIFRSQYAPHYVIPYMLCVMFFALMGVTTLALWWATFAIERDTRRISAKRRAAGRNNNEVVEDEVKIDEKVAQRAY
ncbi:hypothetical protein JCM6882_006192 [Rhodosporidiobolus microsporus]